MKSTNTKNTTRDCAWLLREKYGGVETAEYARDIKRLAAGEPLAYVIGWVPFLGATIFLDSRPLIPRPETEFWLEQVLGEMRTQENPFVLDLFSGSGALGVAILKHHPGALVDFGELEERHISTIEKNIRKNGIDTSRARVFATDVWSNVSAPYDYIVANPPYLNEKSSHVEESVRLFEPLEALFAKDEGLELIRRFIEGVKNHLNPGGVVWCEHDPEQSEAILEMFEKNGMSTNTLRDQFGINRLSMARHTVLS